MDILFAHSDDLIATILVEWLHIFDVIRFDTACIFSKCSRENLHRIFAAPQVGFKNAEYLSNSFDLDTEKLLHWLLCRKFKLEKLAITDSMAQHLQISVDYLTLCGPALQSLDIHTYNQEMVSVIRSNCFHLKELNIYNGCDIPENSKLCSESLERFYMNCECNYKGMNDGIVIEFPNLKELTILGSRVSDSMLIGILRHATQLQQLNLDRLTSLTETAYVAIGQYCHSLESLTIRAMPFCSTQLRSILPFTPLLTELVLACIKGEFDAQVVFETVADCCPNITELTLSNCDSIPHPSVLMAFTVMLSRCVHLRSLSLITCVFVTSDYLSSISMCAKQLRDIDLYDSKVDNVGMAEIAIHCRQLERIRVCVGRGHNTTKECKFFFRKETSVHIIDFDALYNMILEGLDDDENGGNDSDSSFESDGNSYESEEREESGEEEEEEVEEGEEEEDEVEEVKDDLVVSLLVNWLDIVDVARLDSASCVSRHNRENLFRIFALPQVVFTNVKCLSDYFDHERFLPWLLVRMVKLAVVAITPEMGADSKRLTESYMGVCGPALRSLQFSIYESKIMSAALTHCHCLKRLSISIHDAVDIEENTVLFSNSIETFYLFSEYDSLSNNICINFPNLKDLIVTGSCVPDSILIGILQNTRKLERLTLEDTRVLTEKSYAAIGQYCQSLKRLSMFEIPFYPTQLASILPFTPHLTELALYYPGGEFDAQIVFETVAFHCPHLTELSLRDSDSPPRGVILKAFISLLTNCVHLRSLTLQYCEFVTDDYLLAIASKAKQIVSLLLPECHVSNAGLTQVAKHCTQLEWVSYSTGGALTATIECRQCFKKETKVRVNNVDNWMDGVSVAFGGGGVLENNIGKNNENHSSNSEDSDDEGNRRKEP